MITIKFRSDSVNYKGRTIQPGTPFEVSPEDLASMQRMYDRDPSQIIVVEKKRTRKAAPRKTTAIGAGESSRPDTTRVERSGPPIVTKSETDEDPTDGE